MEVAMDHTCLIVVGVDGSPAAQRALGWAVSEVDRRREPTSVQAITVWQWDPTNEPESVAVRPLDPRDAAERMLTHAIAVARAGSPDVAIAGEVLEGDPAATLIRASAGADMLVLGSHGHSAVFHAMLGSVADACVRGAACPVVVIPVSLETSPSIHGGGEFGRSLSDPYGTAWAIRT
jgi:nucleotide-binding universal stress UspA family protein